MYHLQTLRGRSSSSLSLPGSPYSQMPKCFLRASCSTASSSSTSALALAACYRSLSSGLLILSCCLYRASITRPHADISNMRSIKLVSQNDMKT